jgi:hypothetical protein
MIGEKIAPMMEGSLMNKSGLPKRRPASKSKLSTWMTGNELAVPAPAKSAATIHPNPFVSMLYVDSISALTRTIHPAKMIYFLVKL